MGESYLSDEKLGDALREPALLARQDHFEHVALELLHDDEDALGRFEHALEIHDARVRQVLQDAHLVLELVGLLGREAHLVDHFDGHRALGAAVRAAVHHAELARAEHLVRKDLVQLADVRADFRLAVAVRRLRLRLCRKEKQTLFASSPIKALQSDSRAHLSFCAILVVLKLLEQLSAFIGKNQ